MVGNWKNIPYVKYAKYAENCGVCSHPHQPTCPLLFFNLSTLSSLRREKCQINRNVTSRMRGLLLCRLIEVPSYLSVWQLLLTSDVFFESESASFGSDCCRQRRSVRVKPNAGLYTDLLLPPAITKLVIHNIVNPAPRSVDIFSISLAGVVYLYACAHPAQWFDNVTYNYNIVYSQQKNNS